MKERGDVEAMTGQLDRPDVSRLAQPRDPHAGGLEPRDILRIHAVVAEVARLNRRDAVDGVQPGTGDEPDGMEVMKNRRVVRSARDKGWDGAQERRDDQVAGTGVVFRGVRIGEAEYVARMLYQSILKAASSGGERHAVRAGELDSEQHALRTRIGTGGRRPECIETR